MVRIILHPGNIKSETDGDIHFVSADSLRRLYDLKPNYPVVINSSTTRYSDDDIHLYPQQRFEEYELTAQWVKEQLAKENR